MRNETDSLSQLDLMDETWLYHEDKATINGVAA
jgi:hypothetical protein